MRLSLLLAVPLLLGLTQIAHAQDAASCDLSALPDPASAYRDGNLQVDEAGGDAGSIEAILRLTGLPQCGYMVRIRPADLQHRDAILANMPALAAKRLGTTAPLTFVASPIIDGIPTDIWSGGTDELFLISAQQLDSDRPYSPDRGALCIGVTRLPIVDRPGHTVAPRVKQWGREMTVLASYCMGEVPRDAASHALLIALNIPESLKPDGSKLPDVGPKTADGVRAMNDAAIRARLNPRPVGWPARDGAAK